MSTTPLNTEKEDQLAQRMARLGVRETDLQESFVRSSGPGGQNVNKTATCVMLVHLPTGIQVKCQSTRQQGMNRFLARHLLLDKIEERIQAHRQAERARKEKLRREKRRPSRGAQQRRLADKSHHRAKKEGRRAASYD